MTSTDLFKLWSIEGQFRVARIEAVRPTTVMVMMPDPSLISINGIHVPFDEFVIRQVSDALHKQAEVLDWQPKKELRNTVYPHDAASLIAKLQTIPANKSSFGQGWSCHFQTEDDKEGGYDETTVLQCEVQVAADLYDPFGYDELKEAVLSATGWSLDLSDERHDAETDTDATWFIFTRDTAARSGMFEEAGA